MPASSNPDSVLIAFTGGAEFNAHQLIYATLDKAHAQMPDMILLDGATPTRAERIAACWARDRDVPQKPCKPDCEHHKKAAPFKRNDAMLYAMLKDVIGFPGTGIQDNLEDKARKFGIRLWDFRKRSG